MKETYVLVVQAATVQEEFPVRVQEALGELVGAAREGLLALSVGIGLGLLAEPLEEEVVEVVGAKGKHDPERVAVRHGHEAGAVTLGGRRTRRFERTREPVGAEGEAAARSTSRSAVSREFVARTRENLIGLMSRRLDDIRLAALMLDGIELKGRCCVVALGISTDGAKIPLGLWDGSTENATVARELLTNLVARGLDVSQGVLCVIDGSKALRKAIDEVLGPVPVQRCIRHKERNVLDHLPERDRPPVKQRLRRAWELDDHDRALSELRALAAELERSHPGAAASLREGIAETLTLTRLGIKGSLKQTLASANPCESMIEIVRRTSRNVKRWQSGDMCLRWTGAGMLEAERQFRKIIGYRDLGKLALAAERELHRHPIQEVAVTLA